MTIPEAFSIILSRRFSSTSAAATTTIRRLSPYPNLPGIHSKYKPKVVEEAQKALTDYLHTTRSLPFTFAEHIGKNSIVSLANLIRKIDFSAPTFSRSFRRLLRYQPINEFEFFFESIGIDHNEVPGLLPSNKFFFSEDGSVLNAAYTLSGFGFPWNMLGKLYKEEVSIFSKGSSELSARLDGFKEYGFGNLSVVGICLAFPYLLSVEGGLSSDIDALFGDLKRVFVELEMGCCVEGNVDAWYEVCSKVRVFYDLGCEKGKVGELICRRKELFLECPEEVLVQKANYFCKFGVRKDCVGSFLLQSPEIFNLDLETPVISVLGLLEHFGLNTEELLDVSQKYLHVLGRNKMANLPNVMKALDLHEWLFNKIKSSNGQLLVTYTVSGPDEDIDKAYVNALKRIESSRTSTHTMSKLDFLRGIGFGENALTIKVLKNLHGSSTELQERFDFLLGTGIKYSKLCLQIRMAVRILSQSPGILEEKINFLCQEMGSSLQYLDNFPAFLCFDLENRVKRRYGYYLWLKENGLCTENYSIASLVATSEKKFLARLFRIHPAAPKQYLEGSSYKIPFNNSQENSMIR
ncbi:Mitochodrial transcription termination factor [Parasponia andersonii]|uniref:Mitochodrial transcription termination factor n=1 Tax=Parasponia andersonii TaxID=3476 RepID=A0A2P5CIK1_PARAD|nr:Mitochodrial transcription termination factor [Parasponia andersonii]